MCSALITWHWSSLVYGLAPGLKGDISYTYIFTYIFPPSFNVSQGILHQVVYCTFKIPCGTSQTVNLFRIIESQWAQTFSNRKLLYHCWNYPRIHKRSFRNSTTADYVDALLTSKGFGWRKFSFPSSLSLFPTPHYCLCCPSSPADGEDWCHVTIERDTKYTKCFFHPLLLSMWTLVSGGRGGAEQTFPLLTPQAVECVPNFTYSQLRQLSTCPHWWADYIEG